MSAPGEPTTIRAHLEAIRDRHDSHWSPCVNDAVAAIAILNNADEAFVTAGRDTGVYRIVPDPVRLVGRVEPHDDNGDTT